MGDKNNLTILQLNDSHGYFNVHPELFWEGNREIYRRVGGYARISTLFNMIKKENRGAVITLDNGDTIHGTYGAVKSQGKALIPILNHLAFDGTTAHWEFAYGPKQFDKIVDKLDYPMLAINCYSKKKGHLVYQPYTLIEKNNLKVGIIGIAANIVDKTMPSHFSKGLRFTLGNQELPQYIEKLQKEEKSI